MQTIVPIFWDFLMIEKIFLSPQVRRSVIISNKLVYTKCLTSCRKTKDLGSSEIRKYQENQVLSPPPEMVSTSKNLLKNKNCTFPVVRCFTETRVCLVYIVNDCRWANPDSYNSIFVFERRLTFYRAILGSDFVTVWKSTKFISYNRPLI